MFAGGSAAAGPGLHARGAQPGRHSGLDRLDDLRVRLDRDHPPPTTCTNALTRQGILDYGYTDTCMPGYEADHFLPLELGGSLKDPRNLWREPHAGSKNS